MSGRQARRADCTWRGDIKRWAREHGVTHATVEGCGPRKRMRILGIVDRIKRTHPAANLTARPMSSPGPHLQVRDADGTIVAVIDHPVARVLVGHHRGEPVFEDRPVIA